MLIISPQKIKTRFFDNIYKPTIEKLPTPLPDINHGKKVLLEEVEYDTYIALYGGHHFHKLYAAFPLTKFENSVVIWTLVMVLIATTVAAVIVIQL